ncbi:MAG: hypothetical protein WBD05_02790, partial [Phycisphaerae bacterium]
LLTALVYRPSRAPETAEALGPERTEDGPFRRLYEVLLARRAGRDKDPQSILLGLEDAELAGLAVNLYERAEAIEAGRKETDTGPGPVGRMLEDALRALRELDEERDLAARSRAARETKTDDTEALRVFAEARKRRQQGFLPPAANRRDVPGG